MTFAEQSEVWYRWLETRKRNPVKPGSLATYHSYMTKWILPRLGSTEIASFGNSGLKTFVAWLSESKLKPKSIFEIVSAVKQIVSSAMDPNGDELYPRKWNNDFIDVPTVDRAKQKAPAAKAPQIERALGGAPDQYTALYALLGGTGLRIGEARAVRYGITEGYTCWDYKCRVLHVRTAFWRGIEQAPKTPAAVRQVDIPERLNEFLIGLDLERKRGALLFQTKTGKALSMKALQDRLEDTGIPGFHSFRRFRVTRLREYGCPEDILKFWLGHSSGDITDRYSKLAQNIELRRTWVERAGLGFELPKKETIEEVQDEHIRSVQQPRSEELPGLQPAAGSPASAGNAD